MVGLYGAGISVDTTVFYRDSMTFGTGTQAPPGQPQTASRHVHGRLPSLHLHDIGIIVYMRLGFLVGQAGVPGALLLLCSAFAIAFLTTLSLSALVSNGQVRGGGLYGSLRKSIGPELAAVIGVMFFAAYTAGIANYAIGFAHALVDQAGISSKSAINVFPWNAPGSWIETLVASIATLAAAVICSWGVIVGTRALLLVFLLIMISLGLSMASCLVSTTDPTSGHTAFSLQTLKNNSEWDLTPLARIQRTHLGSCLDDLPRLHRCHCGCKSFW